MQVINSLKSRITRLPIHSAVNLVAGSLMIKGTTGETDLGTVVIGAADTAVNYLGILSEKHEYSKSGSALVAGAVHSAVITGADNGAWFAPIGGNPEIFPSRQIELIEGMTMVRMDYALTGVAVSSSSSTVTVNSTGAEADVDTGFLYFTEGEAKGELRFIAADGTNLYTTSYAPTTMTTAGYYVKILPLFHGLYVLTVGNTTTPTKIGTTAAAGAARLIQLERHIVIDGVDTMMDPYTHGNMDELDHKYQLGFYGVLGLHATMFSPLS